MLYASVDIEADGSNPESNSMRSIGIAFFREGLHIPKHDFQVHIRPQLHAKEDPVCMQNFWADKPKAWSDIQKDTHSALEAMTLFTKHIHMLAESVIWLAKPKSFDWLFLKEYVKKYAPQPKPDMKHCIDISAQFTVYTQIMNTTDKRALLTELSLNSPYTHKALDDAVAQGTMYCQLQLYIASYQSWRNTIPHPLKLLQYEDRGMYACPIVKNDQIEIGIVCEEEKIRESKTVFLNKQGMETLGQWLKSFDHNIIWVSHDLTNHWNPFKLEYDSYAQKIIDADIRKRVNHFCHDIQEMNSTLYQMECINRPYTIQTANHVINHYLFLRKTIQSAKQRNTWYYL